MDRNFEQETDTLSPIMLMTL